MAAVGFICYTLAFGMAPTNKVCYVVWDLNDVLMIKRFCLFFSIYTSILALYLLVHWVKTLIDNDQVRSYVAKCWSFFKKAVITVIKFSLKVLILGFFVTSCAAISTVCSMIACVTIPLESDLVVLESTLHTSFWFRTLYVAFLLLVISVLLCFFLEWFEPLVKRFWKPLFRLICKGLFYFCSITALAALTAAGFVLYTLGIPPTNEVCLIVCALHIYRFITGFYMFFCFYSISLVAYRVFKIYKRLQMARSNNDRFACLAEW